MSLLSTAIQVTKQTESSQVKQLLRAFAHAAQEGKLVWQKNLTTSINAAIAKIDQAISLQLAEIMHQATFKKLEGSWRGLQHLLSETSSNRSLKIKLLNLSKREAYKDLSKAVDFDQSEFFKKIYEHEFGSPGGEPYGILIGDFEFSHHPEDIELLRKLSNVAAASFCPFISAASAHIMGFESWSDLANPRDLEKIFASAEYAPWRSFRETEDARFVTLTLPRVLARLPYGRATLCIDEFQYEEALGGLDAEDYCWMNSAYVLGSRITQAFSKYGWATAIRGAEGGGKVANLPLHTFAGDDADLDAQCPTEIGITDRREAELSKLGFLPLCHYKNTDYAVFFGAQTVQLPKKYDRPEATANAAISARLPYMLATSRFAHYLKVMARDKIGSFMEASDCEAWLNHWILSYVNGNAVSKQELKAKYPLAEALIKVSEIPGQPGSYHAIAWLRPWLQLEELTTSLRLVANIPKLGK